MRCAWSRRGRLPWSWPVPRQDNSTRCAAFVRTRAALLSKGLLWKLTVSDEPGVYGMDDEVAILRCPWHSFDYDVRTGECIGDARLRVKTYPVYVEDGQVLVDL